MGSLHGRLALTSIVSFTLAVAPAASAPVRRDARLTFVRSGGIYVASADLRTAAVYLRPHGNAYWRYSYLEPAWSRDGASLSVTQVEEPGPKNNEGLGSVGLLVIRPGKPEFSPRCDCGEASWSPNNKRVVSVDYGSFDPVAAGGLYLSNPYRKTERELTSEGGYDAAPAWSPDGYLIAFARRAAPDVDNDTPPGPPRLFVISPTGGGLRQVTTVDSTNPTWSPDGKSLAIDNGNRIGIVRRSGGPIRFIARGTYPAWSPDGTAIAFVRGRNVWLVDPAGRHPRLAIRNAADPAWRPMNRS